MVDFAGVFGVLGQVGFTGPYTMEVEGTVVKDSSTDGRAGFVEACIAHLKGLGVV